MGLLRPSATGRYIYAVAVWLDGGRTRRQIVRTPDLGASWCLVATADPIADVIPAPAKESVLYAVTAASDPSQRHLLRTDDGGTTWNAAPAGLPPRHPSQIRIPSSSALTPMSSGSTIARACT